MDITDRPAWESEFEKVAYSSDVYPIEYLPNFHELEYAVPLRHSKEALRAVRKLMLEDFPEAIYPIEYRFTAGDGAWMSPFFEQDSVTISVSGQPGTDYWDYLRAVDQILLALAVCLGLTMLFTLLAILTFNPQHAALRKPR